MTRRHKYMPQLDGLRALAVALVAYSHWIPLKYQTFFGFGIAGVQLFFVLSGFLITGILLRCRELPERRNALRSFYARRFLRIFPLYYATLAACYVLGVNSARSSIFWHLAYLSNFYFFNLGGWEGPLSHFWSLAVEEQFYLIWPAIVLFVPQRYLAASIVGLWLSGVASRAVLPALLPETRLIIALPNMNFDALGLGAILAGAELHPILRSISTSF
jgi:peptidoglycan/LPS O-acetylase OafA/YrhL